MTDAFEQICVIPEHEPLTAFCSTLGTFTSRVIQQGDLNGPSTCQCLLTHIFRERIGRSIYVYLDDIFIFSDTYAEHEENLYWVRQRLMDEGLYISSKKLDIYSTSLNCLGHTIDENGLHSDSSKMARIRNWPTPASYCDVQQFLGLVQYLQHFMPDVSSYASILSGMCANGRKFVWREIHQKAFDSILHIASHDIILCPIDASRSDPIWLICDASTSGVGAILAQGPNWETACLAAFMSKRLTSAQHSYYPMELEALAALEGIEKFHDKLTGIKFTIVTDHQALEFFKNRSPKNPQHIWWVQHFIGLDFDFLYVRGKSNTAADALSQQFANDPPGTSYESHDLVDIDARLDLLGEDLPYERLSPMESPISRTQYQVIEQELPSGETPQVPRLTMGIPVAQLYNGREYPQEEIVISDDNDNGPPPSINVPGRVVHSRDEGHSAPPTPEYIYIPDGENSPPLGNVPPALPPLASSTSHPRIPLSDVREYPNPDWQPLVLREVQHYIHLYGLCEYPLEALNALGANDLDWLLHRTFLEYEDWMHGFLQHRRFMFHTIRGLIHNDPRWTNPNTDGPPQSPLSPPSSTWLLPRHQLTILLHNPDPTANINPQNELVMPKPS
jgi:hypothetical protein